MLTHRNVKVRYRGSFLGIFWSLLNPLIMTGLYTIVFGRAFAKYYHGSIAFYVIAVFIGLVVNGFFATSTTQAMHSVVSSGSLINKIRMPLSVYPMSVMLSSCFQLLTGALPFLCIVALIIERNPLYVIVLLVPLLALILLAVGFAFMASALYVFFRDIPYLYELVMFSLWVTTPVFYPLAIVAPKYRPLIEWNPITQVIESIRAVVFLGTVPSPFQLLQPLICGLVIAFAGWAAFHHWNRRFMDFL